ncbi:hypothetical protein [Streptomyces sp. CB01881]|uniref:hypothetical protein n=1 Tax=Streptomyces sp. CB01881 TaxID=2078691 RepID=UPI000CDC154D|nr:hypothetical protein [Streptomyces sp. CB01881]AUY52889.1 hypothetical protein C2142_32735 [Streptomyces sp. CB01881]TYC70605.1 hypothetical protein EH183_32800 [Streptomyces sp. CB01881]
MNPVPLLSAVGAIAVAVTGLAIAHRLRPAVPEGEIPPEPHATLSSIGSGLLSGFILLTSFLIATGWASHTTGLVPPRALYAADLAAGLAVLLYPALAGLPFTPRYVTAVCFFAALVGYTMSLAVQLRP